MKIKIKKGSEIEIRPDNRKKRTRCGYTTRKNNHKRNQFVKVMAFIGESKSINI